MTKEEQVIDLCRKLVSCPSVSGEEKQVAETLASAMRELGYDQVTIDRYGNVIGRLQGSSPGPRILFDGHIDTVPVSEPSKWTHDPYRGEIQDGRMYGRGTSDMKGAVAAITVAAARFAKERKGDFPGELYVAGVVCEEIFEGVSARAISEAVEPDYVVIGEATQLNLKIGQRGRAELVVETVGKPAHSANPEKGINAVGKMLPVLTEIGRLPPTHQEGLGDGILVLTDIISQPYPGASVVPERCIATFDRRLLVGETPEGVLEPIQKLLDDMMQRDPELQARVYLRTGSIHCYTGEAMEAQRFFPGWKFDEDAPFVQAVYQALCQQPHQPQITNYSFCTNGSHYAGEKGIATIGYGPSYENLAHTVDEYIDLEQLTSAVSGYQAIIQALVSNGSNP